MRKLLHWGGSALAVLGVLFVALRIRQYGEQFDPAALGVGQWLGIAGLALLYGGANGFLAFAWWRLLARGGINATLRWVLHAYGLSQLAKYLPGNVFHIAGRQALGMAAGWPARPLATAIFLELVLLAVAGALFSALLLPVLLPSAGWFAGALLWGLAVSIGILAVRRLLGRQASQAIVSLLVFLLVSSAIFVVLTTFVSPASTILPSAWPVIAGAFVIAWLVGLVTPGAPAGVGVRELVLLVLLKPWVAEADLLLAVILGRLVTVLGDLLFFLAALAMRGADSRKCE
ncbi:hypothetical protein NK553_10020 [Pseudomonas sp. ZM23]|uniref:Uncharacterized protein n=1 Tax=Pseudomonas triclosanedens TaxID=2961893 RepID=A0ABY7A1Z6_9PSED|nr:hypothetical protein [Pseudomonas triclosanedens]MCP8464283.1 hypothetical protein [Pseudomonas triclosanedens]MCP8471417.1 hypothetical protein [Pseudomonas triclosanedens]MCP8477774.1 hypothetical protein [Pseudomonas triclosanedens]WAI51229.1 hypothetical protein OU419_08200 [Pseudomonas triclosanedens]